MAKIEEKQDFKHHYIAIDFHDLETKIAFPFWSGGILLIGSMFL